MLDKLLNLFRKKSIEPNVQLSVSEMNKLDDGIISYDTGIVGYPNREVQWKTYKVVASLLPNNVSILDFGCGRGDFIGWYSSDQKKIKYTGIDFNSKLIDAGNELYKSSKNKLICINWFSTKEKADWCININSLNYLYKKQTKKNSFANAKKTIKKMVSCANEGVIITMASEIVDRDNIWIKYNPGDILNWVRKEYSNVIIDHTSFQNSFILVIYKNKQNG